MAETEQQEAKKAKAPKQDGGGQPKGVKGKGGPQAGKKGKDRTACHMRQFAEAR